MKSSINCKLKVYTLRRFVYGVLDMAYYLYKHQSTADQSSQHPLAGLLDAFARACLALVLLLQLPFEDPAQLQLLSSPSLGS